MFVLIFAIAALTEAIALFADVMFVLMLAIAAFTEAIAEFAAVMFVLIVANVVLIVPKVVWAELFAPAPKSVPDVMAVVLTVNDILDWVVPFAVADTFTVAVLLKFKFDFERTDVPLA